MVELEGSRATSEELAAQEPNDQLWQERLGDADQNLADAKADSGDVVAALELWRKSLGIAEQLAAHDPKSTTAQANLVNLLERVAVTLDEQGEAEQAAALFPRLVTVAEALAAQAPQDPVFAEQAKQFRKQAAACCKKRRAKR